MTKYIVQGGSPLFGEVHISGAKNAAVAILPAALLVDGVCRIENIPQISDVTVLLKILEQLGAKVRVLNRSDVELDCRHIVTTRAPQELAHKLRASYYLIGALLGRFGEAEVSMPGGCNFGGTRPIDQHVKGFAAMGATVREGDYICAAAEGGRMRGANIYLDVVSVGATMNIMMAAALADGTTVIENAAKEPHIVDLANFLNSMGADVKGAGTDTIRVAGVERLHGGAYAIIPDQIEAGTYMAAVAATGGQIRVRGIIPKHMDCITAKLQEMGVEVEEQDDDLIVRRSGELRHANVKTLPRLPDGYAAADHHRAHAGERHQHRHRGCVGQPLPLRRRAHAHGRADPRRGPHRHRRGRGKAHPCQHSSLRPARGSRYAHRRARCGRRERDHKRAVYRARV